MHTNVYMKNIDNVENDGKRLLELVVTMPKIIILGIVNSHHHSDPLNSPKFLQSLQKPLNDCTE